MPGVAAAAAMEALGEEPPPPAYAEVAAPVKRSHKKRTEAPAKRKRRGPRSRKELARENAELRERMGILAPPESAGAEPEPAAVEVGTLGEPAPAAAPLPPIDPQHARDLLGGLLDMIFNAIARERGEHWRLQTAERDKLALHFGDGAAPWLPNLGASLPWLFGAMALVTAIQERVAEDKKQKQGGPPHGRPAEG